MPSRKKLTLSFLLVMAFRLASCISNFSFTQNSLSSISDFTDYSTDWTISYLASTPPTLVVFSAANPTTPTSYTSITMDGISQLATNCTITDWSLIAVRDMDFVNVYNFTDGKTAAFRSLLCSFCIKIDFSKTGPFLFIMGLNTFEKYNPYTEEFTFLLMQPLPTNLTDFFVDGNIAVVLAVNPVSSEHHIYLIDLASNPGPTRQSNYSYGQYPPLNVSFSAADKLILVISAIAVNVYSIDAFALVASIRSTSETSTILMATICNGVLVVIEQMTYAFYEVTTWAQLQVTAHVDKKSLRHMKCFQAKNSVGFYDPSQSAVVYLQLVTNLIIAANPNPIIDSTINLATNQTTNQTSTSNLTIKTSITINSTIKTFMTTNNSINTSENSSIPNIVNLTQATFNQTSKNVSSSANTSMTANLSINASTNVLIPNLTENSINQTLDVPQNQNANKLPEYLEKIQNFNGIIKENIKSKENKQFVHGVVLISSFVSSSTLTHNLFRFFICLLQDLWFYAYHSVTYPEIVQLFSSEIDLLNELRLKPQMFKFQLNSTLLLEQNAKYSESGLIQLRANDKVFMLQSVKNLYTINLSTIVIMFLALRLLCSLARHIRHHNRFLGLLYHFLARKSVWWTLPVSLLQFSITPFAFFSFVQFNAFVCFDSFCKFNHLLTVTIFFCVVVFVFLAYLLVFKYERRKLSVQVLENSERFAWKSFWLEVVVNFLRNWLKAGIHGIFISRQLMQVAFLVLMDAFFVAVVFFKRRKFESKINFMLLLMYFLAFLLFDAGLLAYSLQNQSLKSMTPGKLLVYQFVFTLTLLFLISITALRILLSAYARVSPFFSLLKCKNTIKIHQIQRTKAKGNKLEVIQNAENAGANLNSIKVQIIKDNQVRPPKPVKKSTLIKSKPRKYQNKIGSAFLIGVRVKVVKNKVAG